MLFISHSSKIYHRLCYIVPLAHSEAQEESLCLSLPSTHSASPPSPTPGPAPFATFSESLFRSQFSPSDGYDDMTPDEEGYYTFCVSATIRIHIQYTSDTRYKARGNCTCLPPRQVHLYTEANTCLYINEWFIQGDKRRLHT